MTPAAATAAGHREAEEHPPRPCRHRPDEGEALPDGIAGFRHLMGAVAEIEPDREEQVRLAIALWSLVHGLAALLVDGPPRALAAAPRRVETLARDVVNRFPLRG